MKLSSQIKPISYLKAHAAEIVRNLGEQREPLVITQNGDAKVVMQDIESYEQTQETMALLNILALGNRQIEQVSACGRRDRTPPRGTVGPLMPFTVLLTNDAARDLYELYEYISLHDAPEKAKYVLDKIESIFTSLALGVTGPRALPII